MVLKHYIKKPKVRVSVTAHCLGVIYLATHLCASILLNISNILFVMSAVYIVVGGTRYIRNVGLFKTFSYLAYKRRRHKLKGNEELRPMSLADYTVNVVMDERRQKPVAFPLCAGCTCAFLSAILNYVHFRMWP